MASYPRLTVVTNNTIILVTKHSRKSCLDAVRVGGRGNGKKRDSA